MAKPLCFSVALSVSVCIAAQAPAESKRIVLTSDVVESIEIPISRDFPVAPGGYAGPGVMWRRGGNMPVARHRPRPAEVWKIPAGKYGLRLHDGTKMIGKPAKGWSVRMKTSFGPVDIPLEQIARLAPTRDGRLTAQFKNGDRVSGVPLSKEFRYDTSYGTLTIRCSDIAALDNSNVVTTTAAVNPTPKTGIRTTAPPPVGGLPRPPVRVFPRTVPTPAAPKTPRAGSGSRQKKIPGTHMDSGDLRLS